MSCRRRKDNRRFAVYPFQYLSRRKRQTCQTYHTKRWTCSYRIRDRTPTCYDRIRRFIKRDRFQVIFAGKMLLIASRLPRNRDSGSRHIMEKAKEHGTECFVLYAPAADEADPMFALNRNILKKAFPCYSKLICTRFKRMKYLLI